MVQVQPKPFLSPEEYLAIERRAETRSEYSDEAYDRGKKFESYRTIGSLAEYVLVSQNELRVEQFLRQDGQHWLFTAVAGLERKMAASNARMKLPGEGWALRKQDGGSNRSPAAPVTKMAAPEERSRLWKKDGAPERKMSVQEARMPVREER